MAWTAPIAPATTTLTAAYLNQQLRDNLLETMPGRATTPGGFFIVDSIGPVRLEERVVTTASIDQTESTAFSASYTDLDTVGPEVSVNTGTRALTWISARMYNGTANAQVCMSYAVSGASTFAAADSSALIIDGLATANRQQLATFDSLAGLMAGINTFTAKYRAGGGGTAYYTWRRIGVWPL